MKIAQQHFLNKYEICIISTITCYIHQHLCCFKNKTNVINILWRRGRWYEKQSGDLHMLKDTKQIICFFSSLATSASASDPPPPPPTIPSLVSWWWTQCPVFQKSWETEIPRTVKDTTTAGTGCPSRVMKKCHQCRGSFSGDSGLIPRLLGKRSTRPHVGSFKLLTHPCDQRQISVLLCRKGQ